MTVALPGPRAVARTSQVEVVARNRILEAHQLHLAGHPWPVIAERTGYRSGKVCAMAVNAYLQRAAVEQAPQQRQQALNLALLRLDALQAAYWESATTGDIKAAQLVLKIHTERVKVLHLDQQPEPSAGERTLVIGGSEEEYVAQLQAFIGNDPAEIAKHWPDSAYVDPLGRTHSVAALNEARPPT